MKHNNPPKNPNIKNNTKSHSHSNKKSGIRAGIRAGIGKTMDQRAPRSLYNERSLDKDSNTTTQADNPPMTPSEKFQQMLLAQQMNRYK